MHFKDKVCLVTGSSRGIGKATALLFAKEGASVVINYVNHKQVAEDTLKEIEGMGRKAIAVKADVSNESEVKQMIDLAIQEFGKLDVLVNSAGIVYDIENWQDTTSEQWQRTLGVHVLGTFFCSKYASPHLEKTGGAIVNVASTNGYTEHYPESIAYNTAKAGIVSMTHDLAKALASKVRVNAVAPGWVNTDMNAGLSDEYMKEQAEEIYMKRIADPSELASAIAFLAGPEASFITSTILKVDGGHD